MTGPVVVTDGDERSALAVVRSLGRAGHQVIVCSRSGRSLAGASRFAKRDVSLPDPLAQPDDLVDALTELCATEEAGLLIPITDAALEAVLPARGRFDRTRVPFPPLEAYRAISDKRDLMNRARSLGIPTPAEVTLEGKGDVPPDDAMSSFPVVIKPARSVVPSDGGRRKVGVAHAASPEEFEHALETYPEEAYPLLVQEHVSGWGEGVFLLRWEGRTVARFAHRRIREKPPSGGASVYRESIPLEHDAESYATSLLDAYHWNGVAMVEFRRSERDGRPYLMEVNGRFWGSLQLAVDAGVDFPRLLVQCASREAPDTVPSYRSGIRSRWWLGDLDHLLLRVTRHSPRDRLPTGSGSPAQAMLRFLVPWRPGDRSEVLRFSDPRPGLREIGHWLKDATRRRGNAR